MSQTSSKYTTAVATYGVIGAALVLATVASVRADESTNADKDATQQPTAGENNGGVSISLKLLPANQSQSSSSDKSPGSSKSASVKPTTEAAAATKADEAQNQPPKPAEPVAADKPPVETGTVELKLLPPKPAVESEVTPDKPTGSVEIAVKPAKSATDEKPGKSGAVKIGLSLPPQQPVESKTSTAAPLILELANTSETLVIDDAANSDASDVMDSTVASPKLPIDGKRNDGDPGDPGEGEVEPLPLQPGDIPLADESQPFDAPAAKATDERPRSRAVIKDVLPADDDPAPSARDAQRDAEIQAVLDYFRTHHENIVRRGPWALMHTILPFGVESEVIAGQRKVNTIGWLCYNGVSAKQRMFQPTQTGFRTNVGPGVQGHEGQFLAILAQSHVSPEYPIQVGKRRYTINDLIRYEMATCRERTELTFKLIAFSHYLDPHQTWRDNRGRPWSIEKLVAEELAQPINGEACGGTHRLMGLTCAVVSRQEAGLPLTGHFARAEHFLNDFIEYTLSLQNPDGSFSTEWFERRANESNVERKVQTTGHTLEWLVYTLPDSHLQNPAIVKGVDFLLSSIGKEPERNWPIGPRGHALRALALYQKRVYHSEALATQSKVAAEPNSSRTQR